MWNFLSRFIIRYRIIIIIVIAGITAFMLHSAAEVRLSYSLPKMLPENDSIYVDYSNFQKKYGEQNLMVIAIEDADLQKISHFKAWAEVSNKIMRIPGVEQVISIPKLPLLYKDTLEKKFYTKLWYNSLITTQDELDIAFNSFLAQPFYKGLLMSEKNHTIALMIKLDNEILLTAERNDLIFSIKKLRMPMLKEIILKFIIQDYLILERLIP